MKAAYVVLGMHRSGTSSVAGALAVLGARAPITLMPPKSDNPLGFWESERIANFNEEIFSAAGSSWLDWGPLDPTVFTGAHAEHFRSASRWLITSEFNGAETIVLKDPRICRAYPFWRAALKDTGYRPLVISPIRSPEEVAASLSARNGTPRPLALRLWLRHVLDAESASRGQPRHLMAWADFISGWRSQIDLMTQRLCAPPLLPSDNETVVDAFLDPNLHRQRITDETAQTPTLIQRAYAALLDLGISGETKEAHGALDLVRHDFQETMRLFYDGPYRP